MPEPLDIQDYLDATSEAAKRTRSATITVVVASVLVFAGLINSLQNSWLLERIHASNDWTSPYVRTKIDAPWMDQQRRATPEELSAYKKRYEEFYSALMRTYVDSTYIIRVPFFGFRVDANDLGVLGGVAFAVILVMLRLSISREVDNLKMSFREAERLGQLREFYTLLAMRQVFTIPETETINRSTFLVWIPKLFCFAPFLVHIAVTAHDFLTNWIGQNLSSLHTFILFECEVLLTIVLLFLTIMVLTRLRRVDRLWDEYWAKLQRSKNIPAT